MSDNPYRTVVEVRPNPTATRWYVHIEIDNTDPDEISGDYYPTHIWLRYGTEAEAKEHAELIRQAMREVS